MVLIKVRVCSLCNNSLSNSIFKNLSIKRIFLASMTMDISNQNKLSDFHEELKRLNINIQRPDINKCFADFKSKDNTFYYALGGYKKCWI